MRCTAGDNNDDSDVTTDIQAEWKRETDNMKTINHHGSKPNGSHPGQPKHHPVPQHPTHKPLSWEELLGRR